MPNERHLADELCADRRLGWLLTAIFTVGIITLAALNAQHARRLAALEAISAQLAHLAAADAKREAVMRVDRAYFQQLINHAFSNAIRERQTAEAAQKRPTTYAAFFNKYLNHWQFKAPSRMHQQLAGQIIPEFLAQPRSLLVCEGPRGNAKSTHWSIGMPLYAMAEGRSPYTLIISDSSDQAQKHVQDIAAEVEGNAALRAAYPHLTQIIELNKSAIEVGRGPSAARIEGLGAGKRIRGRRFGIHRPRLTVTDDPEADDAAFSVTKRDHRREWYLKGVLKAGDQRTSHVCVGTRIHAECLTAKLSQTPGWRHVAWQSMLRWPTRMDLWNEWELTLTDPRFDSEQRLSTALAYFEKHRAEMENGAEVLWSDMFPLYDLMMTRAVGHAAFESEHQNNPIDPSKCEWPPHLLDHGDMWFDSWPSNLVRRGIGIDPSKGGQDKSHDFSAIVDVGLAADGTLFVEADLQRRDVDKICRDAMGHIARFNPDFVAVEADQFQFLIGEAMIRIAGEQGIAAPVVPIMTEGVNKAVRIRRLGPFVSTKRLKFKSRSPGTLELIRQLVQFPTGDHDDGPDGMEMAVRGLNLYALAQEAETTRQQTAAGYEIPDGDDQ